MTDFAGIETKNFPVATSFGVDDNLLGFRGTGDPGSELRYPAPLFMGSGGGGGGNGMLRPEDFGAVGNANLGGTLIDDTLAFYACEAALPPQGGRIWLDPEKCYAINWAPTRDNIGLYSCNGAGDANVLTGLTSYLTTNWVLNIGFGRIGQLRNFHMNGVRVYSQTKQLGVRLHNCAYGDFVNCEIGGFTQNALAIDSEAGSGVYYTNFFGCKFFAVSGSVGDMINAQYGAGFVAAVSFIGCSLDGSAGGTGFHVLRIGAPVDLGIAGRTWIQCNSFKGVIIEGVAGGSHGNLYGGVAMIDGPSTDGSDVLIEYPGTELAPTSFIDGHIRIDGKGLNGLGTGTRVATDIRGVFGGRQSFLRSPIMYRPSIIGAMEQIDTSAPALSGPMSVVGGGTPSTAGMGIGSFSRSVNNGGSSNTMFVETDGGQENVVTGGFLDHVAPNISIDVSGTADLVHDITGAYLKGNFAYIQTGGGSSLSTLGIETGSKRRLMWCQFISNCTLVHNGGSTAGIFICGVRRNISVLSGDMMLVHNEGNHWRMILFVPSDGRAF